MESFFRTHKYLIEHLQPTVRRDLMDEINWKDRMIGVKGARGVGKTTFLLQYAKENFSPDDHTCLYINTNNFYVQNYGIANFAGDFYHDGGKVLLIDQVFKQPNWSQELRECYDRYPGLKIVFAGSSVMRLKEENPELNGIVKSYNLRGFSFREFLNLKTGQNFRSYTLDEIMDYLKAEKARGQLVDFIEYSKNWISSTSIKGKKNYQSALNSFVSFLHKDHLSTKEITHRLLQDYMTYLTKQHIQKANELIKAKKRVPSNRTVSLYLGSLRHLFNEAKKDYNDYDRNIIVIGNSPFENLIIPKQEATRKRALSVELIKKIYELPYITTASGKEHQRCAYNIAKDCFILSFCLIGMNSVDLFTCSESEKNSNPTVAI